MSLEMIQAINYLLDFFVIVQVITSAVMCIYGYKWRKGLIATMSMYIGFALGVLVTVILLNAGAGLISLWSIPVSMAIFWYCAYRIVTLNHFLAGFLLTVKISYMILYTIMDNGLYSGDSDVALLLVLPIIIGVLSGFIIVAVYNNYVVILCISFIGAVELGSRIAEWINTGTFLATLDISLLFDPMEFILGIFGIETVGTLETILILLIFIVSFIWQKYKISKKGITLSDVPFDDRKHYNEE